MLGKPIDECLWSIRKQAHTPRRHVEAVQIKLRPVGSTAPEPRIVADDRDGGGGRQQFDEIADAGNCGKSSADDHHIIDHRTPFSALSNYQNAVARHGVP